MPESTAHTPAAAKAITTELTRCVLSGDDRPELRFDPLVEFQRRRGLLGEVLSEVGEQFRGALDRLGRAIRGGAE